MRTRQARLEAADEESRARKPRAVGPTDLEPSGPGRLRLKPLTALWVKHTLSVST
jgi:hypothetical protein